ncbi:bacillithiol system redox-active protein YtxJ [Paenibacillus sp. MZ04-78.2]|uniref:bacillithiol system redox-active protein YtxJ n=1 Tax=Paenibacillus sp. MZ04-78.2 TaxID=2962034 RepID=UPI0020B6518C|nr:bacillithiol system redox-active protein YtxJ [Paenibacillus sp. MZ04-78.2]MCP3775643.1 bacillithiol system redox-active protein YtxJ [Paenibacillus sp. MZ04-78.2]
MAQWKEITTNEEWEQLFAATTEQPIVVLKHSTACSISFIALEESEAYLSKTPNPDVEYVLVKVIESRPVSNQIAEDTGLRHVSPQLLYIKNKEVVWDASHWNINEKRMTAALN